MKESFKVVRVDPEEIEMVRLDDQRYEGDCSKCALSHICHGVGKDKVLKLRRENVRIDLKENDVVEIEPPEWLVTKLSFLVYIIPLLVFVSSALLSYSIFKDEKISFYISILSLLFSAFLLKSFDKLAMKKFVNNFKMEKKK